MAGEEKDLIVTVGPWAGDVIPLLSASAHDELVTVETVRQLVESKQAVLYRGLDGESTVWAIVVRINRCELGDEAVIVAAGAALPGYSMTRSMVPILERIYSDAGCKRLRINASRRGMEHELDRLGFARMAAIFIKELDHVF